MWSNKTPRKRKAPLPLISLIPNKVSPVMTLTHPEAHQGLRTVEESILADLNDLTQIAQIASSSLSALQHPMDVSEYETHTGVSPAGEVSLSSARGTRPRSRDYTTSGVQESLEKLSDYEGPSTSTQSQPSTVTGGRLVRNPRRQPMPLTVRHDETVDTQSGPALTRIITTMPGRPPLRLKTLSQIGTFGNSTAEHPSQHTHPSPPISPAPTVNSDNYSSTMDSLSENSNSLISMSEMLGRFRNEETGQQKGNLGALWAAELQALYIDLSGKPVTLAQLIDMRKRGTQHLDMIQRNPSLLQPPVPPSDLGAQVKERVTDAAKASGISLLGLNERLFTPTITRNSTLVSTVPLMREILTANGMPADQAQLLVETEIGSAGGFDVENLSAPRFVQFKNNKPYDQRIWNILVSFTSILSDNQMFKREQQRVGAFLSQGIDFCRNYFLGSGTRMGQMGRIAKGVAVMKSTEPGGEFDRTNLNSFDDDAILFSMRMVFPIKHCDMGEGSVNPLAAVHESEPFLENSDGTFSRFPLFVFNQSAHDGPPWNGSMNKRLTTLQDLAACLDYVHQARSGIDDEGNLIRTQYDDLVRLVHIKSKVEVQNFEECFYSKNRNIFPDNVVVATLLTPLQRVIHRRTLNFINHNNSRCLGGISMCTTGMGDVIGKMISEVQSLGRSICFYADNIHILESTTSGEPVYCSIDLKSEEARHDYRTVYLTLRHILESAFDAKVRFEQNKIYVDSVNGMDTDFAELLLNRGPTWLSNCIGIIGTCQTELCGMPSGCPLTYDVNCCATAPAIHAMMMSTVPLLTNSAEPTWALDEILKNFSLPYKVELSTGLCEDGSSGFKNSFDMPMTVASSGKILRLSMLGFDAALLLINFPNGESINMTFAVLEEERYHKMFWFSKHGDEKKANGGLSKLAQIRDRLVKYTVAYLALGGFLPSRSAATLSVVNNAVFELRRVLGNKVDLSRLLGFDFAGEYEEIRDVVKALGMQADQVNAVTNAVGDALKRGLVNFGSVVAITQSEATLTKLGDLAERYPSHFPVSLLTFDPFSADFDIASSTLYQS